MDCHIEGPNTDHRVKDYYLNERGEPSREEKYLFGMTPTTRTKRVLEFKVP